MEEAKMNKRERESEGEDAMFSAKRVRPDAEQEWRARLLQNARIIAMMNAPTTKLSNLMGNPLGVKLYLGALKLEKENSQNKFADAKELLEMTLDDSKAVENARANGKSLASFEAEASTPLGDIFFIVGDEWFCKMPSSTECLNFEGRIDAHEDLAIRSITDGLAKDLTRLYELCGMVIDITQQDRNKIEYAAQAWLTEFSMNGAARRLERLIADAKTQQEFYSGVYREKKSLSMTAEASRFICMNMITNFDLKLWLKFMKDKDEEFLLSSLTAENEKRCAMVCLRFMDNLESTTCPCCFEDKHLARGYCLLCHARVYRQTLNALSTLGVPVPHVSPFVDGYASGEEVSDHDFNCEALIVSATLGSDEQRLPESHLENTKYMGELTATRQLLCERYGPPTFGLCRNSRVSTWILLDGVTISDCAHWEPLRTSDGEPRRGSYSVFSNLMIGKLENVLDEYRHPFADPSAEVPLWHSFMSERMSMMMPLIRNACLEEQQSEEEKESDSDTESESEENASESDEDDDIRIGDPAVDNMIYRIAQQGDEMIIMDGRRGACKDVLRSFPVGNTFYQSTHGQMNVELTAKGGAANFQFAGCLFRSSRKGRATTKDPIRIVGRHLCQGAENNVIADVPPFVKEFY